MGCMQNCIEVSVHCSYNTGMLANPDTTNLQAVTLYMAGDSYDFWYDHANDAVYPALFPGMPVERFWLPCGTPVPPDTLKMVVKAKLRQLSDLADCF